MASFVSIMIRNCQKIVYYFLSHSFSMELSGGVLTQGSKLTLVRWPVASGFSVGPVKSAINWPGWFVKFWNPTSEFTWLIANFSYWMNLYCKYFNWIHWYKGAWDWQTCTELNIERDVVFTIYKRASESLVGPVEFRLHWSGGPVGWKC